MTWKPKSEKKADPIVQVPPKEMNEQQDYFRNLDAQMFGLLHRLREV